MRSEFEAWLRDKEQAEREGIEFNEPMPGTQENGNISDNGDL